MINSRKLTDLHPKVAAMAIQHIDQCKVAGIDIIITSTFRDAESQNALYAQGRTKPGKIVTRAKAGQSMHNYRLAYDVVPLRNGKPVWTASDSIWLDVGRIGKVCGLDWAGDWKSFKEFPHFQFTGGLTMKQLQEGMMI